MRNIELKARLHDPESAHQVARRLSGNDSPAVLRQRDTYFKVPAGRLKLREQDDGAELIYYERDDSPEAGLSVYSIARTDSPEALLELLGAALGIGAVVRKKREVYISGTVRIHLDDVEGLGSFIEFEAVLAGEGDEQAGRSSVEWLTAEFAIGKGDLVAESYADLIERAGAH